MTKKYLILAALISGAVFAASSFTTYYNLELPTDGDTNWGSGYRDNMTTIDTQLNVGSGAITAHIADTVGAHAATAISSTSGTLVCTSSSTVQAYLDCLDLQVGGLTGGSGVPLLDFANTFTATNTFQGQTNITGSFLTFTGFTTGLVHTDSSGVASSSAVNLGADVSGTLPIANGGTNGTATAATGAIAYGTGTAYAFSSTGSTGQVLQSGSTGAPTWSTATFPSTAASTGTILRADGTNWTATTVTYPTAVGATGAILRSNGTDNTYTIATYPAATGATGSILRSTGLGNTYTSATYPDSTVINQLLYSSATNTIAGITASTTAVLTENTSGVPSWTQGTTANRLLRTDGTTLTFAQAALTTDVSGTLPIANGGTNGTATAATGAIAYGTGTAYAFSSTGTTGQYLKSNGTAAPSFATFAVPTIQKLTAGSGTYTTPANVSYLKVYAVGAGGGGGGGGTGASTAGGTGANTTFGATITASGGVGGGVGGGAGVVGGSAGGAATGPTGAIATPGGYGHGGTPAVTAVSFAGGNGGVSCFGGGGAGGVNGTNSGIGVSGPTNSGGGGGGGGSTAAAVSTGGGGGGGGCVIAIITAPTSSFAYVVGAGGAVGASGTTGAIGGTGAAGIIVVEEYYQ